MASILLGLFDGYMDKPRDALTSETKLGGVPVYFPQLSDSQEEQIKQWTTCGVCGHRMFLLVQAYSPLPGVTSPHNRMLYVFCCNSASCALQPLSSWVSFSVQVDQDDADALDGASVAGEEPHEQAGPIPVSVLPPSTFPPCYLYIEEEPKKETIVPTDIERQLIEMAEASSRSGGDAISVEDLEELEREVDLKNNPSDDYYEKFRSRIARCPTQVIRYHQRVPPVGTQVTDGPSKKPVRPIFMAPYKAKQAVTIPCCASCGASRVFEMQIIPTALYYVRPSQYMKDERRKGDDGVDFGTATVYVCSRDCAVKEKGVHVRREFVFVEEPPSVADDALENKGGRKSLRQLVSGLDPAEKNDEED